MPDGSMHRRALLRAIAGLAVTGSVAGCIGDDERTPASPAPGNSPADVAPATGGDDASTLESPESKHSGTSVPQCPTDEHVTFAAESDVFRVDRDDDAVESHLFTLTNDGECPMELPPDFWRIDMKGSDGWDVVAVSKADGTVAVGPGETHQWSLSLSTHPTPRTDEKTFVFPDGDFPAGTYAFWIGGDPTQGSGSIVRHAVFELRYESANTTTA